MRQHASCGFTLVAIALCLAALAHGQSSQVPLDFAAVVQKVEAMQRSARLDVSYQAFREYRLYGRSEQCTSDVLAEIQHAPASETYAIQKRTGSARGEQVVRRLLEHEAVLATGDADVRSAALLVFDGGEAGIIVVCADDSAPPIDSLDAIDDLVLVKNNGSDGSAVHQNCLEQPQAPSHAP